MAHLSDRRARRSHLARTRLAPVLELLDARLLLATHVWDSPTITWSIAEDGAFWSHGTNNLNAVLDGQLGRDHWTQEVARALQTWATAVPLDFIFVEEDGRYALDVPGRPQGDSRFGDIRIGGYLFPETQSNILALGALPPPGGWTISGDIQINTQFEFQGQSGIDLYSLILHEFGHTLGLRDVDDISAVMSRVYGGVRDGLTAQDVGAIQSLYGPRQPDAFNVRGEGIDAQRPIAIDLEDLDDGGAARIDLDLTQPGEADYLQLDLPTGSDVRVTVSAEGQSMLSPKLTVLDPSGVPVGSFSDPDAWGNTLVEVFDDIDGSIRLAVSGATGDVFDIGSYHVAIQADLPAPIDPPSPIRPTPTPSTPGPVPPTQTPTSPAPVVSTWPNFNNARPFLGSRNPFLFARSSMFGRSPIPVTDSSGGSGLPNARLFAWMSQGASNAGASVGSPAQPTVPSTPSGPAGAFFNPWTLRNRPSIGSAPWMRGPLGRF